MFVYFGCCSLCYWFLRGDELQNISKNSIKLNEKLKFLFHKIPQAMTKQERVDGWTKMVNECAAKEGAPASEVESILAHRGPSTHEGKCIGACFGETTGVVRP